MKRRLVAVLSIIIFLFGTVNITPIYAAEISDSAVEHNAKNGQNSFESLYEEGKTTVYPNKGNQKNTKPQDSTSSGGAAAGSIASFFTMIPNFANILLTAIINSGTNGGNARFSIQNTVFNQYPLFSINFFSTSTPYRNNTMFNKSISENVAQWFKICRNLSIVILLGIFIYVGIRMLISTVALQKAKYKKMLIGWIESIIILFTLHYIFIVLIMLSENILTLIKPLMDNLNKEIVVGETYEANVQDIDKNFENKLITGISERVSEQKGWNKVWPVIEYFVLVFYQVKFFILYLMRKIKVAFLIIISPLITITYSADKIGDHKAQAFDGWTRELIFNIFIQDLHAIMYLVFVLSAASIASKAPALAIVFLMALSNAEKIVKKTFNLKGKGLSETFSYKELKNKHFGKGK